MKRNQVQRWM